MCTQKIINYSWFSSSSLALKKWCGHGDPTDSVVLVLSHVPTEEHTQEKISEDREKEGFDILMYSSLPHTACPPLPPHASLKHPVWWSVASLGALPTRHLHFIKWELWREWKVNLHINKALPLLFAWEARLQKAISLLLWSKWKQAHSNATLLLCLWNKSSRRCGAEPYWSGPICF